MNIIENMLIRFFDKENYKKIDYFNKYKKKENIKIYDCFLFFNENDLLEVRLHELDSVVDYFIIVESEYTFTQKKKSINFDHERFAKFKDKIIYICNKKFIKIPDPWHSEKIQRNLLSEGLKKASPNDLIMLSDLDEIPKSSSVIEAFYKIYGEDVPNVAFEMDLFSYKLNNKCTNCKPYDCSVATRYKYIQDMETFRRKKSSNKIKNAGWHFSSIGEPEEIILKLESFSHREYNKWPNNDINFVKDRLSRGHSHLSHSEDVFTPISINKDSFPKYLFYNQEKYAKLILGETKRETIWTQIMHFYNKKVCQIKKYTLGLRNKSSEKIN